VFPQVASGPAYAALRREQRFAKADPAFGESLVRSPVQSPITALSAVASAKADHYSRPTQRDRTRAPCRAVALRKGGFTLIELLVVIGIIGLLMVLLVPAFTSLRGGTDVTSAAYTIKGVLDTARTYAKANNTYTWVGFYEENVSNPSSPNTDPPPVGRVIMSIAASKDGTILYDPNNLATINPINLTQVGKLTKIENVHLWTHTDTPAGIGSTFDTRPNVASTYCIGDSSPSNSATPFQYPVGNPAPSAQYTFLKAVQFSPRGEARINNNSNTLQTVAEIGLEPTHGAAAPASIPANVVAVQFTGVGGDVRIYRR
jgi:prepilin-type N-terminal cleavage/methylation domain-containing protein